MLAKLLSIIGLVATGLLLILITTTPPADAGAMGILVVFLLSYVVLVCGLTFIVWSLAKIVNRIGKRIGVLRSTYIVDLKKSYYYSSVLALGPIIVVSLQSVGGVGIYEVCLVLLFVFLGCLYVSRRTS